jgi:hypothetical protein
MKKVIVTTTINPPTQAIELFQSMEDWELVVVGDLKTPSPYRLRRGTYLRPSDQHKYDPALSEAIGWNCIMRRNFGLLAAHDMGADIVALVDDDNIPYVHWGKELMVGREVEVTWYETDLPAFDPLGATNHPQLWHRGFPLQLVAQRHYERMSARRVHVDFQADLWDGDPDIDAVCRMEHAPECRFDSVGFPIAANKPSPVNSQNTFLSGQMLKDYFLYPHIGRMDDIWAGYYAQSAGYRVAYGRASVRQERNPHDPIKDMRAEYLGYENNLRLVTELAADREAIRQFLPQRSIEAWELYRKHFHA